MQEHDGNVRPETLVRHVSSCTSQISLRGVEPRALKQMTATGAYCTQTSFCLNAMTAREYWELHFSLAAGGLASAFNMHNEKVAAKHHVADMGVRRQSDRRGGRAKSE